MYDIHIEVESLVYILCICRFKNDLFPCGEKVKGHIGAIYRVHTTNILHQILVEDLLMMLYTKYKSSGPCSFRQEDF